MAPVKLRYLVGDTDKRGNVRWYVRVPGRKKVRIRATKTARSPMPS